MKKSTSIRIENNGFFLKLDVETSHQKSQEKIQKALVYRFFDYYDVMRSVRAKGFKATEPFNIRLESEGKVLFTTEDPNIKQEVRATLKLTNTPKGRTMFEERLYNLMGLALRMSYSVDETLSDGEVRLMQERIIEEVNEVLAK